MPPSRSNRQETDPDLTEQPHRSRRERASIGARDVLSPTGLISSRPREANCKRMLERSFRAGFPLVLKGPGFPLMLKGNVMAGIGFMTKASYQLAQTTRRVVDGLVTAMITRPDLARRNRHRR